MVIQNREESATTPLRADALSILEAGYESILTDKVVNSAVMLDGAHLHIHHTDINLDDFKRVFVIGIGKAALDACGTLEQIMGDRITDGLVLDVRGGVLKKLKSVVGTHPLPSEKNMEAAKSIAELLEQTEKDDLVLTVISGGGSALLCLPNDMTCAHVAMLTDELMKKGATISELNAVRKHTSKIQGGQFAKLAHPARIVSLILSDVPGNDLATIASGPTVKDETTLEDAQKVLKKYSVHEQCKECKLLETPKDDKYFEHVDNVLILSNTTALDAMKNTAEKLGYVAHIKDCCVEGNAVIVAEKLLQQSGEKKTCNLYGGEVTVVVDNPTGVGGRNQHLSLAALQHVVDDTVVIAAASDGWDNGDVAGAISDSLLRQEAHKHGAVIADYLAKSDSYNFFKKVGGQIVTGRTGANVSDLYLTLHG